MEINESIMTLTKSELYEAIETIMRKILSEETHQSNRNSEKKIMTPKEVAKEYKMHVNKVYEMRKMGIGPTPFKIGRRYYYHRDVVENYFKKLSIIERIK